MRRLAVLMCLGTALALWAQPGNYQLDPDHTGVSFTLGDALHTVQGTFRLKSGTIQFDPTTGAIGGQVVVDATSGKSGNSGRDHRMHSAILESTKYPEIVFQPDRVEGKVAAEGDSDVRIHGVFSIHGGDHEMTVPARVHIGGDEMTADLHFSVPYVKWGMKNPSVLFLRVGDHVEIAVHAIGAAPNTSPGAVPTR